MPIAAYLIQQTDSLGTTPQVKVISPVSQRDSIAEETTQPGEEQVSLIDAAFKIPGNPQLKLDTHGWHDKAAEYLEHAVARTPKDLRSQVQRVYLHIESGDEDALYGALVDMFIALEGAGRALRQRLLEASRTVLDERRYRLLAQCLEAGIGATDSLLPCPRSLLSKGLRGTSRLVMQRDSQNPPARDPLQDAREHVEYGQLDEARNVLEAAVLEQPQRLELHQDLLEIYRYTKAKQAFQDMWGRLDAVSNPAAEAWREQADLFAAES